MKYRAGHGEEQMTPLSVEYCRRAREHLAQVPWVAALAAVKECKAKRLSGELKTYVQSAMCSNPGIVQAFGAVEAGGLLSYGADFAAMHRQAATQVAKILKGTKVGDIPIEQPNRFQFSVNLRTAKAIGIKLPTSTLLLADEVIE
jgi:ABC-type uncharacterized transport system substrate-binding protein